MSSMTATTFLADSSTVVPLNRYASFIIAFVGCGSSARVFVFTMPACRWCDIGCAEWSAHVNRRVPGLVTTSRGYGECLCLVRGDVEPQINSDIPYILLRLYGSGGGELYGDASVRGVRPLTARRQTEANRRCGHESPHARGRRQMCACDRCATSNAQPSRMVTSAARTRPVPSRSRLPSSRTYMSRRISTITEVTKMLRPKWRRGM